MTVAQIFDPEGVGGKILWTKELRPHLADYVFNELCGCNYDYLLVLNRHQGPFWESGHIRRNQCSDGVPSIFDVGVLLLAVLAEDLSA